MNRKQEQIVADIFTKPTRAAIGFAELEKLVAGLGGEIIEGNGSRVKMVLNGAEFYAHRPHPQKEAKKYQVEAFRDFLEAAGIKQ